MSQDNGTPSKCTNTQFAEVSARVTKALPKAMKLSGLDIKSILNYTDEGERLSRALAEAFRMLYNGDVATCIPAKKWTEGDGFIEFDLLPDGTTGPEWIKWHDENGYPLSDEARFVLNSPDFKPSPVGIPVKIRVLKGELFEDVKRTTINIRADAGNRNLEKPNADIACLIRKTFTNKEIEEMGLLWIITMHEPIDCSDSCPRLLGADRRGARPWLSAYYGRAGSGGGCWVRVAGAGPPS